MLRTVLGGGGKSSKASADAETEGKKATPDTREEPKSEYAPWDEVGARSVADEAGSCSSVSTAETR